MKRRIFSNILLAGSLAWPVLVHAAAPVIDVYKSESCGCCGKWVEHLQANGFTVNAHNVADPADYRQKFGIPQAMGSCHTAKVGGYALEGHVPATDIKRLLKEKPKAIGLAVPGMPHGSPGMETGRNDAYDVMLVQADGKQSSYRHVDGKSKQPADAATAMSEGEVRKVDKGAGKITIKHGPLANLDMPPMTMVFRVKDAAMLEQVRQGDKILFVADKINGAYTVTQLEAGK